MRKKPLSDVIGDLFANLGSLVQAESELAQAEVKEAVQDGVSNIVTAVAGAILMLPAAVLLFEGIALALIRAGVGDYAAYLIVGAVAAAVGAILVMTAVKKLKKLSLLPRRTIHQFKRDVEVAKYMRNDHESDRAA